SGVAVIEGTNDSKILSKLSEVKLHAFVLARNPNFYTPTIVGYSKINADGSFRIGGLQACKAHLLSVGTQNTKDLLLGRIEYNGATLSNDIEIEAGQQMTGVRVVLIYSSLKLRGELKVIGLAAAAGLRFRVSARRVDLSSGTGAEVDARGQFVL